MGFWYKIFGGKKQPAPDIKSINLTENGVEINGTLVSMDSDGEKTDRYVSVKRCVFDNDEL